MPSRPIPAARRPNRTDARFTAAMGWLLNRPASHPDCAQRPVRSHWLAHPCSWCCQDSRRRSWRAAAGSAVAHGVGGGPGATRGHIGITGRASRLARILSACNGHARNQSSHCEQSGYNFHFGLSRSMGHPMLGFTHGSSTENRRCSLWQSLFRKARFGSSLSVRRVNRERSLSGE